MSGRGNRGGGAGGRGGGGRGGRDYNQSSAPGGGGRGGRGGGRRGGGGYQQYSAPGVGRRGGGGYQPPSAPSQGRGGSGLGGGRGRGNAGTSGYISRMQQPPSAHAPSSSSASSLSSLGGELQKKLTVGPSVPTPAVAVPSPVPAAAPVGAVIPAMKQAGGQPTGVQTAPVSSKNTSPPLRPEFGGKGIKCFVRANHFVFEVSDIDLHHYDVTITPDVTSKKVCRDILSKLVKLYRESHMGSRRLAYDGKNNAFTAGALPFESKEFEVKLDEEDGGQGSESKFQVAIRFAAKPDMEHLRQHLRGGQHDVPQETIQALDVVLRTTPSNIYEVVERVFFDPTFGKGRLGEGLEYWKGFYQSLRPTQMGLTLNVDTLARPFYEPISVSNFVRQSLGIDTSKWLSDQDRVKIERVLKGVKVETTHTGFVKTQKISGLSTEPLNTLTFHDKKGVKTYVVNYFESMYERAIESPHLPAIQVGTDAKLTYLPMEICKIKKGQRYTRKLNERQLTSMSNATCKRPSERADEIEQIVANNYNQAEPVLGEFGIRLEPTMVRIGARVLPAPTLKYHKAGKDHQFNPVAGKWTMLDKEMVNGGRVDVWACVNFSSTSKVAINKFCKELVKMCSSKGMAFNPLPVLQLRSSPTDPPQIETTLRSIREDVQREGRQLQLLIVILPDFSGQYGKIKRVCEIELGIVSQCCQPKHVPGCAKQYLSNVALKINVKVGGRNTVLLNASEKRIPYLTDSPTIIFGADVTHPQPGDDSSPSIAAVVASMDWPEVSKYRGLVSAQPHRQEIIQNLYHSDADPVEGVVHSGMIRELLTEYVRKNHHKPDRIIFYRDGVGNGQFNQVLSEEIDQIRKACASIDRNYLPSVTFVVVQKRHHTRLFPDKYNNRGLTDRSGNILPGTVVDTEICHPTQFDFYLCSHAGIRGTSRPTHYHVLCDENHFTADALQCLTNDLCYTYARCTSSVSIVPPAYYTHLAAFRARYYIEGEVNDADSSAGAMRDQPAAVRTLPRIHDNVQSVMFYC